MQKETTGSSGAWNSFMDLEKDTPRKQGVGYVEKIKIHWILDDRNVVSGGSSDPTQIIGANIGTMWALSYANSTETVDGESGQIDPDDLVCIRAAGSYGNMTIPVERAIKQDGFDPIEGDGSLRLYLKNTDVTDNDTLVWRIYVEVIGKWVKGTPL